MESGAYYSRESTEQQYAAQVDSLPSSNALHKLIVYQAAMHYTSRQCIEQQCITQVILYCRTCVVYILSSPYKLKPTTYTVRGIITLNSGWAETYSKCITGRWAIPTAVYVVGFNLSEHCRFSLLAKPSPLHFRIDCLSVSIPKS